MKRIALIIPYFGNFKNYFPLFLVSCKNNPSVDWIVFTDDRAEYPYPQNVKVIYTTFEKIEERIQKHFDFHVLLDKPYKLCDYRPAYGEIFSNELRGYDFWGYCDIDLIFGNIRKFLDEEILEKFSKIFTRGHFSLYKNEPDINSFYRNVDDSFLRKVFTSERPFNFDEWGGISRYWSISKQPYYDELCMDDIRSGFTSFRTTKEMNGYGGPYNEMNKDLSAIYKKMQNIVYSYENGALYRCFIINGKFKKEEVMYAHFQKRNLSVDKDILEELISDEKWLIVPNYFTKWLQLDKNEVKKIAPKKFCINDLKLEIKLILFKIYRNMKRGDLRR